MANSRRRRNAINKIKINGIWLIEDNAIQKGIIDAFKGLLSESRGWRPALAVWKLGFLRKKSLRPFQASMVRRPWGQMVSLSSFGLLVESLLRMK